MTALLLGFVVGLLAVVICWLLTQMDYAEAWEEEADKWRDKYVIACEATIADMEAKLRQAAKDKAA